MECLDELPPDFNKYLGKKGMTNVPELLGNTKTKEAQSFITELRHPLENKVPVVLEPSPRSRFKTMETRTYLVPADLSVAQFYFLVRKRFDVKPEEGLFFVVNGTIAASSAIMGAVYEEYKNPDDKMLYFMFCEEDVFG